MSCAKYQREGFYEVLHRVGREGASCCEVPRQPLTWQREKSQELVKVQFSRELFMDDYFEISDLCRTRTVLPPLFELTV